MRKRVGVLLAVLLVSALLVPSMAAAAVDKTIYSSKGISADAWTWTEGEDGSYESFGVWGGSLTSKWTEGAGKPAKMKGEYGFLYWESYTPETDTSPETYRALYVGEAPAAFSADRNLTWADLAFTAEVESMVWYDEMPWECEEGPDDEWICPEPDETDTFTADVSAHWTGFGPLWQDSFKWTTRTDGLFSKDMNKSTYRQADAHVSIVGEDGTVYYDGEMSGQISESKSGGMMKGLWPDYF